MRKFIDAHWNFIALFIVFFMGDVLYSIYQFVVEKEPISIVLRDLMFGAIAIVVVLYILLKFFWKGEDESVK